MVSSFSQVDFPGLYYNYLSINLEYLYVFAINRTKVNEFFVYKKAKQV